MDSSSDFATPRALSGSVTPEDPSAETESTRLQRCDFLSSKEVVPASPSSSSTTATSPFPVPSLGSWSHDSESIMSSPHVPVSFRSLDPAVSPLLSQPLLDVSGGRTGRRDRRYSLRGRQMLAWSRWPSTRLPSRDGLGDQVYWESSLVVLPMYSGYAALFGLQHLIKAALDIDDEDEPRSYAFSAAVSCVYICSFISRMGHGFLFCAIPPRGRVFLAMLSMLSAMLLIAVVIVTLQSQQLYWVVIAYSLGGVGIGCFESNFLSCLTPLGHETKQVAITGIPMGITLITVGGFFLLGPPWGVPPVGLYVAVAVAIIAGIAVMAFRIPGSLADEPVLEDEGGLGKLLSDAQAFRKWLPQMWHYALTFAVDMCALAAFCPGVLLYVYDKEMVVLKSGLSVPTNTFIAVVSVFNMLGGTMGRWLSYRVQPRHPIWYSPLTSIGVLLLLLWVPLFVPVGVFLVMMGDGLIYGSISKHIDVWIPRQFNLIAISLWLLIGDVGSILGSNLVYSLKCWTLGS